MDIEEILFYAMLVIFACFILKQSCKCKQVEGLNVCIPNSEGQCPYIDQNCPDGAPSPAVTGPNGRIITGKIARCCEGYFSDENVGDDNCNQCITETGCSPPPKNYTPPPSPSIIPSPSSTPAPGQSPGQSPPPISCDNQPETLCPPSTKQTGCLDTQNRAWSCNVERAGCKGDHHIWCDNYPGQSPGQSPSPSRTILLSDGEEIFDLELVINNEIQSDSVIEFMNILLKYKMPLSWGAGDRNDPNLYITTINNPINLIINGDTSPVYTFDRIIYLLSSGFSLVNKNYNLEDYPLRKGINKIQSLIEEYSDNFKVTYSGPPSQRGFYLAIRREDEGFQWVSSEDPGWNPFVTEGINSIRVTNQEV